MIKNLNNNIVLNYRYNQLIMLKLNPLKLDKKQPIYDYLILRL